jgi:hypothetical protein
VTTEGIPKAGGRKRLVGLTIEEVYLYKDAAVISITLTSCRPVYNP